MRHLGPGPDRKGANRSLLSAARPTAVLPCCQEKRAAASSQRQRSAASNIIIRFFFRLKCGPPQRPLNKAPPTKTHPHSIPPYRQTWNLPNGATGAMAIEHARTPGHLAHDSRNPATAAMTQPPLLRLLGWTQGRQRTAQCARMGIRGHSRAQLLATQLGHLERFVFPLCLPHRLWTTSTRAHGHTDTRTHGWSSLSLSSITTSDRHKTWFFPDHRARAAP
ncbi:hypothetical protein B0T25DRAFT_180996 [Lasiosphaeria hispida]|uniref:Uncharacterized protein n=1 Tax=Lasiosphaeria hispida TaxID=260671 RepID=A0AAJ0MDN2_9PEZI|nr:hypothetical protein B0T25DRAFT_180996 [Lasiosphaeria hispida]